MGTLREDHDRSVLRFLCRALAKQCHEQHHRSGAHWQEGDGTNRPKARCHRVTSCRPQLTGRERLLHEPATTRYGARRTTHVVATQVLRFLKSEDAAPSICDTGLPLRCITALAPELFPGATSSRVLLGSKPTRAKPIGYGGWEPSREITYPMTSRPLTRDSRPSGNYLLASREATV
jgi:hypothetical protein